MLCYPQATHRQWTVKNIFLVAMIKSGNLPLNRKYYGKIRHFYYGPHLFLKIQIVMDKLVHLGVLSQKKSGVMFFVCIFKIIPLPY